MISIGSHTHREIIVLRSKSKLDEVKTSLILTIAYYNYSLIGQECDCLLVQVPSRTMMVMSAIATVALLCSVQHSLIPRLKGGGGSLGTRLAPTQI